MAEIKILLDKEELKEKEEFIKVLKTLNKKQKLKLKGFLQGIKFTN